MIEVYNKLTSTSYTRKLPGSFKSANAAAEPAAKNCETFRGSEVKLNCGTIVGGKLTSYDVDGNPGGFPEWTRCDILLITIFYNLLPNFVNVMQYLNQLYSIF